jgi:hypothetical protein
VLTRIIVEWGVRRHSISSRWAATQGDEECTGPTNQDEFTHDLSPEQQRLSRPVRVHLAGAGDCHSSIAELTANRPDDNRNDEEPTDGQE